ncbi:hypothetical protein CBS101457_002498 [Exobasidium rhododendri]|nr:hypothetical protein CBS101457_002498 [Exobasidium rhododendri]
MVPLAAEIKGTYALLFSTLNRKDGAFLAVGVVLAAVAGVIPAIIAKIIGSVFNAFAAFNPDLLPISQISQEKKDAVMHTTLQAVWKLCLLGGGTMVLSTVMISTWIIIGEKVGRGWRLKVYDGFSAKKMKWFETDLKEKAGLDEGSESIGSGGIMAKFARETDEVRIAASQTFGQMIETLATILASLILAFVSCWSLTLVVLASIPLTAVLIGLVQSKATPLHVVEMENMARAGNILERCIQSITTVKAFASEKREEGQFMAHVDKATQCWNKLAIIYGGRLGLSGTLTLAMFTSGFWYGTYMVQAGKVTPGNVITTFWSCLLIGNGLSTMLATFQIVEVGKVSATSLSRLISDGAPEIRPGESEDFVVQMHDGPPSSMSRSSSIMSGKTPFGEDDPFSQRAVDKPLSPVSPKSFASKQRPASRQVIPMRKIRPDVKCLGEINFQHVSFSYPSRPNDLVLNDVSMYFPSGETTFIIGGSGSGKSTLAHLLLRLYDGYSGEITLDEQDIRYLDSEWTRSHVAALDQSAIIFDMTVRDNVALGHCGKLTQDVMYKQNHVPIVERQKIVDACKMALLHNDIQRLEQGYETPLGSGGVDLSGGQKQRLALARAIIRDPTVLILDECTSALDVKSRLLIIAFIKKWRRGKTTIIITHDLQQVDEEDFLYLLEKGRLVEQGYRKELESNEAAYFSRFIQSQTGVARKEGSDVASPEDESYSRHGREEKEKEEEEEEMTSPTGLDFHATKALQRSSVQQRKDKEMIGHSRQSKWASDYHFDHSAGAFHMTSVLPSLIHSPVARGSQQQQQHSYAHSYPEQQQQQRAIGHRQAMSSISTTSSSDTPSVRGLRVLKLPQQIQQKAVRETGAEDSLELVSVLASLKRPDHRHRKAWSEHELGEQLEQQIDKADHVIAHDEMSPKSKKSLGYIVEEESDDEEVRLQDRRTLMAALKMAWLTQPKKAVLVVGFLATVASAFVQPAFSFVLGKLLATMGRTDENNLVLQYALIVLGLAFIDGIVQFLRFSILQYCANIWIRSLRAKAIAKVFGQDKAWFDKEENSSSAVLTKLIKDGEDAKSFISRIVGELLLVVVLISTAFVWALIVSWQLTLAGIAMGPIFYAVVLVQSRLINRFERQNKLQRERVSKRFYNMLHNIRGIRSMSLERVFWLNFNDAVQWVEYYGIQSAPLSGFGYGLRDACTYLAEALLYYVGARLLVEGKNDLEQVMIVLNLILFAVASAAQIMAYLPGMSKSLQSIYDLVTILRLDEGASSEFQGRTTPPLHGGITFRNVHFTYPSSVGDEGKVLNGCSFEIRPGEKVALVGQSGCGKSTIASLLFRLYEPTQGSILFDNNFRLDNIQVQHLRKNIAIVQQRSDLFDDTIRNNILYGNEAATPLQLDVAIQKSSSRDIIHQVKDGLDTIIGDKASTISGGQKQRIAIARALVRDQAKLLILDECTSALDSTNQEKVAKSLLSDDMSDDQHKSVTTLIVTHKLEMMRRCDRILVLEKGRVVQSGHFTTLIQQKGGAFSVLANAGEWGA